ncbi:chemotaxis protein MotB [Geosporobacter subterraneus DSM 17957]|uniref:Chemotaxis protein MotB n=1 Tax=Geosporobacter subterraneus DSM 17957 TaxID=1121919 RepID=A0A1M6E457_9FIRM|nr:OmpA family protein [Geosporobacter subterraneus]SHI80169.1 chemotaxis protein MotB [Geosporobacter subterraneus DSM 17957]
MKRKRAGDEAKSGAPEWMTTYGDLVTLLLCFFVLLFAFSSIDAQKFSAIMQSFQGSLGVLQGGKNIEVDPLPEQETSINQLEEQEDFRKLKEMLEAYLEANNMANEIMVDLEARGLLLRFKDNVLFDSGKADIKPDAKTTLRFLADLLKQEEFNQKYIRVEGHTDSDPIVHIQRYPTNWELSVSRASNVVRVLIEEAGLKPDRLSASGYSQYHPVAPNDTAENKSKNRRVDIVILRSEFVQSEPYH